jgi:hypothetical protein
MKPYSERFSFFNGRGKSCEECSDKPKRLFLYRWREGCGLFCSYECFLKLFGRKEVKER